MKKTIIFTIIFAAALMVAKVNQAAAQTQDSIKYRNGDQYKSANLTYTIIPAANKTYCYDINAEGRLFIHQPSAPALPGNEGFKTKEDAEKVAQLVIKKIRKGEMPPTVTIEELDTLKVLHE